MELWIRNQNKETLELTTYLQIIYLEELDQENKWVIEGGSYLGYYKTKERALEVLDDIVELIKHIKCQRISSEAWQQALLNYSDEEREHLLKQMCVYQMPEN